MNTAIVKIRKRSQLPPLSPVNENDYGNADEKGEAHLNGRYKTSTEPMRSPPKDSQTHAQNDNDLAKSGDGGNGEMFL